LEEFSNRSNQGIKQPLHQHIPRGVALDEATLGGVDGELALLQVRRLHIARPHARHSGFGTLEGGGGGWHVFHRKHDGPLYAMEEAQ
jgi:hypothetical protein